MLFKATILIQHASNVTNTAAAARRLGGFSESWYFQGSSPQDLYAALGLAGPPGPAGNRTLMDARANMLPNGSSIVGVRVQQLDPLGPSQSFAANRPGFSTKPADVPQMALLCTIPGLNVKNIRRAIFRAIPDADVVEGELVEGSSTANQARTFFSVLQQQAFRFRGVDLAQPTVPIITILSDGTVTLGGASAGFAVNDRVKILRTVNDSGDVLSALVTITAIPGATSVKLGNWLPGPCTGGTIRKHAFIYPLVDGVNCSVGRVITRRVGRPFTAYRGRRSRR
jgi:hypothetical protein